MTSPTQRWATLLAQYRVKRGDYHRHFDSSFLRTKFVSSVKLTDGHELYILSLQKLERHGHVLQLHLSEGGSGVVFSVHLLLTEHLEQRDESQSVAQVQLQVRDAFVGALQVLVTPASERVLLDLLPRRVVRQVLLCGRHDD